MSATSGVLYVHSCPAALVPHVEWAVAAELGARSALPWSDQPAAPGALRAEIAGRAGPGPPGGWRLRCAVGRCCATR